MQQDGQHSDQMSDKFIDELWRKLTVILACTQLLQRQSQRHEDVTPELINSRVAMIEAAATDMIKTLRHLEDLSSENT